MRKLLIVFAAFAFVVAFTLPAMADDGLSAYGNARVETWSFSKSKDRAGTYDDDDLIWQPMVYTARIGFKYKREDVGGHVELRPYHTSATGAQVRHFNGTWKFGAGTIMVGQSWTPTTFFPSNQSYGDTGMGGYGALPCGRKAGLWLLWDGLKVALLEPNAAAQGTDVDTDTSMPKLEASYKIKLGPATIAALAGMNSFDSVNATDQAASIDSSIYGVYFTVPFGAVRVSGNYYVGTNLGNYGDLGGANVIRSAEVSGTTVYDTDETGMCLKVSYKISDSMTVEGGYGVITGENNQVGPETDEASVTYAQLHWKPTKSFSIIPEFGKFDYAEDANKVKQGDITYVGAKWQINF